MDIDKEISKLKDDLMLVEIIKKKYFTIYKDYEQKEKRLNLQIKELNFIKEQVIKHGRHNNGL